MLCRLNLPNVFEDDLQCMSGTSGRSIDSPDSGLPPSPSAWLLPVGSEKGGDTAETSRKPTPRQVGAVFAQQLHLLSYGEGVVLDPLPLKEVRYSSSVRYDSDRHFIYAVSLQPRSLALESCSQTVVALSHSSWRHYRTQLHLALRHRVQRYQSTTIVYLKHAHAVYVTHLRYVCCRRATRFVSSVELEPVHH